MNVCIHIYLEPETSTLKWLFQLDDSKSLHEKLLFHQTSIKKWLFGVPGVYIYIHTHKYLSINISGQFIIFHQPRFP